MWSTTADLEQPNMMVVSGDPIRERHSGESSKTTGDRIVQLNGGTALMPAANFKL